MAIPAAFTDSVLAGRPVALVYANESTDFAGDYHDIRMGRAVYTLLADLVVSGELVKPPTAENLSRLNQMPRALQLEVAPAGERQHVPTGYEQTIPGTMVMFVLLVMCTSGAILLVIERKRGLLRRLAYTPISRTSIVLGKWGGKFSVGIVQIVFAMLAGTLLFKMDWGPDLGWVIVIMLVYGALMAALGMLLGNLATSEGVAAAIGVISANVLAALGGCWWPIEITAAWMQKLQLFLPTGWAMDAMHKLISFGAGPASIMPHLVGMVLLTIFLVMLTVRVFRYEDATEIAPLINIRPPHVHRRRP
jgi:ABC-type Na+ efflux pump permease subunit